MINIKNALLEDVKLGHGKVTYNDFEIDLATPLKKQRWSLKQDLLQIDFNREYLIDIGWYPDFNINGYFF